MTTGAWPNVMQSSHDVDVDVDGPVVTVVVVCDVFVVVQRDDPCVVESLDSVAVFCSDEARHVNTVFDSVSIAKLTLFKARFAWLRDNGGYTYIDASRLTAASHGDAIVVHSGRKSWKGHTAMKEDRAEWSYAVEVAMRIQGSVELYVTGEAWGVACPLGFGEATQGGVGTVLAGSVLRCCGPR